MRRQELIGLALLLALIFLWTLAPLQGYDLWFYLAVGRDVLDGHTIPWAESYLGTTAVFALGAYANHAWVCCLVCYMFYSKLGTVGLVLLRSLLLCSTSGVTYLNCRLAGMRAFPAWLLTALGLWSVRSRFLMRSYLFTDLMLALLTLALLVHFRSPNNRRLVGSVLAIFVLWTNTHQGYVAGLVLVFLWVLFGAVPRRMGAGLVLGACLATLLRPHGIASTGFFYDVFSNSSALTGVLEWESLGWWATFTNLGALLITLAHMVGWRVRQVWGKREDLPPLAALVVLAAFLFLGLRSMRGVSTLLPVAVPMAALWCPQFSAPRWLKGLGLAAVLGLYAVTYQPHSMDRLSSLGLRYPVRLAAESRKLGGQVFNSYEFGNFLAFQKVPPFIHGMTALYKPALLEQFLGALNGTEAEGDSRESILSAYQVEQALVHYPTPSDAHTAFVEYLYASPHWKLHMWDDTGLLFVRGPAAEGYVHLQPWRQRMYLDPVAARPELERAVQSAPSARAFTMLSEIVSKEGDHRAGLDYARKAVLINPDFARAWSAVAVGAAHRGDLNSVLEATRRLVELLPEDAVLRFHRAQALLELHQRQSGWAAWWTEREVRSNLERTLELKPDFEPAAGLLRSLDG